MNRATLGLFFKEFVRPKTPPCRKRPKVWTAAGIAATAVLLWPRLIPQSKLADEVLQSLSSEFATIQKLLSHGLVLIDGRFHFEGCNPLLASHPASRNHFRRLSFCSTFRRRRKVATDLLHVLHGHSGGEIGVLASLDQEAGWERDHEGQLKNLAAFPFSLRPISPHFSASPASSSPSPPSMMKASSSKGTSGPSPSSWK